MYEGVNPPLAPECTSSGEPRRAQEAEVLRKNRAVYDHAIEPIWELAVYRPLHRGWRFASIGGREVLDLVGARARGRAVLEVGAGAGDGCIYLARAWECQVRGIDVNERQVTAARARLADRGADVRHRVQFEVADVRTWRPPQKYAAVFSLDTFGLIPDVASALDTCRAALEEGGTLVIADLAEGSGMTPALRSWIWETDGMIGLVTEEGYRRRLRDAGFIEVEALDRTEMAAHSFEVIGETLAHPSPELVASVSEDVRLDWLALSGVYRDAFRRRAMAYLLLAAH